MKFELTVSWKMIANVLVEADSYYDKVFLQRLNLWKINDTIKRFFLNPALGTR